MSALQKMILRDAEATKRGHNGYVTTTGELKEILNELTEACPIRIWGTNLSESWGTYNVDLVFNLDLPLDEEKAS